MYQMWRHDDVLHGLRRLNLYETQMSINYALGAFIDRSKAFNTVDHNILITKLENIE